MTKNSRLITKLHTLPWDYTSSSPQPDLILSPLSSLSLSLSRRWQRSLDDAPASPTVLHQSNPRRLKDDGAARRRHRGLSTMAWPDDSTKVSRWPPDPNKASFAATSRSESKQWQQHLVGHDSMASKVILVYLAWIRFVGFEIGGFELFD